MLYRFPAIPERYKGKQFDVPYQPKGKGADAMIDKNMRLTTPVRACVALKDNGQHVLGF
jgi:hypothetical protein